ncbi:MAG: hypothetical protein F6J90_23525 [Moorea sp. SIOASIH]|uniref:hypothetical protein n=1 Tax=Moorena sp. SIOASIH TaxID=2607817 RepID=UPI0013B8C542|nr:hypothetical protein [Moorena sp. SIOASIH]NEO39143.1 hypothetical protein [Moorena sp. SIOASIH]
MARFKNITRQKWNYRKSAVSGQWSAVSRELKAHATRTAVSRELKAHATRTALSLFYLKAKWHRLRRCEALADS